MKRIKIIISLILIFIGIIFVGEYGIIYLDNFANDMPNTTIIYQPGMDHENMKKEVEEAAHKYNVEFFVVKQDVISTNEKNLILYSSSPNIKKYLSEDKGIYEREYTSLFFGKVDLSYDDYKNISSSDLEVNNNYYLFGNKYDIKNFKISLINKYAGNHPRFPEKSRKFDYTVYGLWTIIFALCLIFTAIYVKTRKGDAFIKIIYGENRLYLIFKEIVIDLIFIVGIGILLQQVLKAYTYTDFYKNAFYIMLGLFALINSLTYFSFYRFDLGKVYKDNSFVTISALYLLKVISVSLVSLALATNFLMIKESLDFISEENFFKAHKDYYYTNLGYIPRENYPGGSENVIEDGARVKEIFYHKYFNEFNPLVLVNFDNIGDKDLVLANRNSLDYLKSEISSIKGNEFKEKLYYFIPQSTKEINQKIESLDLRLENYFEEKAIKNKEIIYYEDKAKIINVDDLLPLNSKISKNPIVIFDNRVPEFVEENIVGNAFRTTYDRDIMYKIKEDKFNDFIKEYKLESEIHGKTNVYENYLDGKLKMKRLLKMEVVISLILIILEIIILLTLTKLEFRINAYKISLMKILGYNFWERYKKLIIFSIVGSFLAMIIFILINLKYRLIPFAYGIVIIGLVFVIEQLIIHREIKKIENHNIELVLKGEFRWLK